MLLQPSFHSLYKCILKMYKCIIYFYFHFIHQFSCAKEKVAAGVKSRWNETLTEKKN